MTGVGVQRQAGGDATLAQHLGLRGLLNAQVNLGDARGRADVGNKATTLIHSALAGGRLDRRRRLAAGLVHPGRARSLVAAPSTLGTFLGSFTWAVAEGFAALVGKALV